MVGGGCRVDGVPYRLRPVPCSWAVPPRSGRTGAYLGCSPPILGEAPGAAPKRFQGLDPGTTPTGPGLAKKGVWALPTRYLYWAVSKVPLIPPASVDWLLFVRSPRRLFVRSAWKLRPLKMSLTKKRCG